MVEEWEYLFDVGDRVEFLNADDVETEAGRSLSGDCSWAHTTVTRLAHSFGVVKARGEYMDYGGRNRIRREIIRVETDGGNVIIGCHPEWLRLASEQSFDTSAIDAMFDELVVV